MSELKEKEMTVDASMLKEADAFRHGLGVNAAKQQEDALAKAIEGNPADYERVRKGRSVFTPLPDGVQTRRLTPDLLLYEPDGREMEELPLLIYFHGGGWCQGSLGSCSAYCAAMAAGEGVRVVAVEYRLAPEHPFPAGLNDCLAAFDTIYQLRKQLRVSRLAVGGDSSGGNLALVVALKRSGMISRVVTFYPVTRARVDNSVSWNAYSEGYGLNGRMMELFNLAYRGTLEASHPDIDVADLSSDSLAMLPPVLMISAGRDILLDQGRQFVEKCSPEKIRHVVFNSAVHLFITVKGQPTAFRKAVRLSGDFLRS